MRFCRSGTRCTVITLRYSFRAHNIIYDSIILRCFQNCERMSLLFSRGGLRHAGAQQNIKVLHSESNIKFSNAQKYNNNNNNIEYYYIVSDCV